MLISLRPAASLRRCSSNANIKHASFDCPYAFQGEYSRSPSKSSKSMNPVRCARLLTLITLDPSDRRSNGISRAVRAKPREVGDRREAHQIETFVANLGADRFVADLSIAASPFRSSRPVTMTHAPARAGASAVT